MSLKHALLGFLNYGPMTGYELKKFFDVSVAHFWNAELSQIYPALKQLESEGLVNMEVDVQEDRPNRKVYSITGDGRRELVDWLGQPAEPEQVREPILVKVFFGASLGKRQLLDVLNERIADVREMSVYLHGCEQLAGSFASGLGLEHEAPFWTLTAKMGLRHCAAEIEWAEEAIRTIEAIPEEAFGHSTDPHDERLHIRTAMDVLERISAVMPRLGFGARRARKETHDEIATTAG